MKQFNAILSSLLVAAAVIFCPSADAAGAAGQIISFDVPGSACQPAFFWCTQAFSINASGAVIGWYADSTQAMHGFLREADGSFVGIDPPATSCGGTFSICSRPSAINDEGTIVGAYAGHNYIRSPDGSFTSFDVPGAFSAPFDGLSISQEGTVTGFFGDANGITHGFIRSRDGEFSVFDPAGAVNGTEPMAINPEGTIVGYYADENMAHGFVRYHDGTIVSFDPNGSQGTVATGINPAGEISGWYQDQNFITHGFVRRLDGSFVSFDAASPAFVTYPNGITPDGVVAGTCQRINQPCGGFVRTRDGAIELFNPLNTIATAVTGINPAGVIVGWYDDVAYLQHAFIRLPWPTPVAVANK